MRLFDVLCLFMLIYAHSLGGDALLRDALCVMLFAWGSMCDALLWGSLYDALLYDALLYGVTSFIANYLITLPQACKPVFFAF